MRRAGMAVLAGLIACAEPALLGPDRLADTPVGEASDSSRVAVATYTLHSVNEIPLPVPSVLGTGQWDYGTASVYYTVSGWLTLYTDSTYSSVFLERDIADVHAASVRNECVGRYLWRSDGTLLLSNLTARPTADGIVWHWDKDLRLTFMMQASEGAVR